MLNDLLAPGRPYSTIHVELNWSAKMEFRSPQAVCGPQKPGTAQPGPGINLADLNPCPLNACCVSAYYVLSMFASSLIFLRTSMANVASTPTFAPSLSHQQVHPGRPRLDKMDAYPIAELKSLPAELHPSISA